MAMAVELWSSSSFIFFPHHSKTRLRHIIYFPFCPLSHSHLRRRLSLYAARDGGSSSRKRGRIKWDSNAETIRAKGFTFNTQNEEEGEEYDDEETASSGILEEAVDRIWIFKVFKSYGWMSPFILLSLLFATGPKAFLMALSLPLGLSAITLAYEKLSKSPQSKQKRKARVRMTTKSRSSPTVKKVKKKEEVEEERKVKRGMKDYQSWAVTDDSSINERGKDASRYGGWDEPDGMEPMRMSSTMANGSKTTTTTTKKKKKSKLSMEERSTGDAPLLLRLLISVFPFLGELFW